MGGLTLLRLKVGPRVILSRAVPILSERPLAEKSGLSRLVSGVFIENCYHGTPFLQERNFFEEPHLASFAHCAFDSSNASAVPLFFLILTQKLPSVSGLPRYDFKRLAAGYSVRQEITIQGEYAVQLQRFSGRDN